MQSEAHTIAGRTAALVLLISLATLAAAWGFQLIGGYEPCPLCLQQRWAWYAAAVLGFSFAVMAEARHGWTTIVRAGLVLTGLVLLAGTVLAGYHTGVEYGWWEGPKACAGGGGLSGGLPDFNNIRLVRCDEVQWRMFGLSFAGWNTVISISTAVVAFAGAGKR